MCCKRSNWKVPFVDIANKLFLYKTIHSCVLRSANVPFGLIDQKVKIHNGKNMVILNILPKHVGLKFGEVMVSKIIAKPKINKKKNLKNFKNKRKKS